MVSHIPLLSPYIPVLTTQTTVTHMLMATYGLIVAAFRFSARFFWSFSFWSCGNMHPVFYCLPDAMYTVDHALFLLIHTVDHALRLLFHPSYYFWNTRSRSDHPKFKRHRLCFRFPSWQAYPTSAKLRSGRARMIPRNLRSADTTWNTRITTTSRKLRSDN